MAFFEWLQSTALAIAVGERWFPWIESTHVVFLAGVAGTIFMVDARLLGLASKHLPVSYLATKLLPWTWVAFAGAVLTGTLMFMANAAGYVEKTPFLIKMGLLLIAGMNMLYFHLVTWRGVSDWDHNVPPRAAKVAGALSMISWAGVIVFGRWIGFV